MSHPHLRTISCLAAEEELLGASPEAARFQLERGEGELAGHLASCAGCRELAHGLALLAAAPPFALPEGLEAAALEGARRELRVLAAERRRAVRKAALRAALVLILTLPLLAFWGIAVWNFGAASLGGLIPGPALAFLGGLFGLIELAGLSAVAFLLTLVAGSAGRPPRTLEV